MADVPDGMAEFLARRYAILQQSATPAPAAPAAPRAADLTGNLKANPFAGMKDGATRDFRGFGANQVGGMTVISGKGSPLGMMDLLRTQGWSNGDAVNAVEADANAKLTGVKANLLPEESAAMVARERANANLANQNARVVVPESQARISASNAGAAFTNTQNRVLARESLAPESVVYGNNFGAAWDAINRTSGLSTPSRRFRIGNILGN